MSMSREEAALIVEQRIAALKALGFDKVKVRNPHDRQKPTGAALIQAQITGHRGVISDVQSSPEQVQRSIQTIQELQKRLETV